MRACRPLSWRGCPTQQHHSPGTAPETNKIPPEPGLCDTSFESARIRRGTAIKSLLLTEKTQRFVLIHSQSWFCLPVRIAKQGLSYQVGSCTCRLAYKGFLQGTGMGSHAIWFMHLMLSIQGFGTCISRTQCVQHGGANVSDLARIVESLASWLHWLPPPPHRGLHLLHTQSHHI